MQKVSCRQSFVQSVVLFDQDDISLKIQKVPPPTHDESIRVLDPFARSKFSAIPRGEYTPLNAGTVAPT